MPLRAPWVVFFIGIAGCYLSHSLDATTTTRDGGARDGAVSRDASGADATRVDASLEGHFWTMEPVGVGLSVQACETRAGQPLVVAVEFRPETSCDHPGPIEVMPSSGDPQRYELRAYVWHEHGVPCRPLFGAVQREALVPAVGGEMVVIDVVSDSFVATSVSPPPPPSCTMSRPDGEMCFSDCDCMTGLRCIPVRGDIWCASFCEAPCVVDLDCPGRSHCGARTDRDPAARACTSIGAGCSTDADCPAGTGCAMGGDAPNACEWTIALNASVRHECVVEEDCGTGLDCVQRPDGMRRCEVRCDTSAMRCPAMHHCFPSSGPSGWPIICEWDGE